MATRGFQKGWFRGWESVWKMKGVEYLGVRAECECVYASSSCIVVHFIHWYIYSVPFTYFLHGPLVPSAGLDEYPIQLSNPSLPFAFL